jgi:hypothetical protein
MFGLFHGLEALIVAALNLQQFKPAPRRRQLRIRLADDSTVL